MTCDIADRLFDGQLALTHTETYVSACRALGYQNADITAHGGQIRDWYMSEAGLDLGALASDCSKLRSAARSAADALSLERHAHGVLTAAWQGESGESASEHIRRHCRTGAQIVNGIHVTADGFETLRDRLWRAVDDKVNAVFAIDARTAGQRESWLAAAATVIGGGPDRTSAIEIVEQQIKPYVDRDIRIDWLSAMRTATARINAAYAELLTQISDCAAVHFGVPSSLVPRSLVPSNLVVRTDAMPSVRRESPGEIPAYAIQPIRPHSEPTGLSAATALPSLGTPELSPPVPAAAPELGLSPGQLPSGMPLPTGISAGGPNAEAGAGVSGLISQIVDAVASLASQSPGQVDAAVPDAEVAVDDESEPDAGVDPERDHDPDETKDDPDETKDDPVQTNDGAEPQPIPPMESEKPGIPPPIAVSEVEAAPHTAPPPQAVPLEAPPQPADGSTDDHTPCEIALTELPQVGQ